jgi:fluoroacetyl-CoA thioesterase
MTDTEEIAGRSALRSFAVQESDLATALGSGDVPVLATPRLIAWMEAATVAAVAGALPASDTTVGTAVEIDHVAASPLGASVTVSATVQGIEGKALRFDCEAVQTHPDGSSTVIGHGSITRAIVDRERFQARLGSS